MQQRSHESGQTRTIELAAAGRAVHLSYMQSGTPDSPPVLLLHGWGSSARVMQPIAEWLAPQHFVINVDLPGHGESPPPPAPLGVAEHADLIRGLTGKLFDRPFVIVGHSNGGRIALFLASETTNAVRISKMALVAPSGVRRRRSLAYYVRRSVAEVLKAPFRVLPRPAREFGLDWLRHSLVWKILGSSDYRALQGVMRETFVKTVNCYLEERLPNVAVPTLIFRGERDDAVTEDQVDAMCRLIPDAGRVDVPGAGHYAFLDRPEVVRSALLNFLSGQ